MLTLTLLRILTKDVKDSALIDFPHRYAVFQTIFLDI